MAVELQSSKLTYPLVGKDTECVHNEVQHSQIEPNMVSFMSRPFQVTIYVTGRTIIVYFHTFFFDVALILSVMMATREGRL